MRNGGKELQYSSAVRPAATGGPTRSCTDCVRAGLAAQFAMPPAASLPAAQPPSTGTVDVETPELVVLTYSVAGIGSRAYAALIDYTICLVIFVVVLLVGGVVAVRTGIASDISAAWATALVFLLQFVLQWGYYVLWEGLADGQTPGKRQTGLRVVRDGGFSVDFGTSAVRNLLRFVDMQPVLMYGIGLTAAVMSRQGKRIGDMVAGTLVVREEVETRVGERPGTSVPAPATSDDTPRVALLDDDEFTVLDRFIARRDALAADRKQALATSLAQRFQRAIETLGHVPGSGTSATSRLVALHAAERDARREGVVALRATGAARERHAIVAARAPRWNAFATTLAEAQRRGLGSLGEDGVRSFVADYRDLTADLARLRTATRGAAQSEVFHLSRLVAGAHNLLYRGRALSFVDIARYFMVTVPREIRRSWRPIGIAAVLLFLPMLVSSTAIVRNPEVAAILLPPEMLDRAEDGVRRAATEGEGYIDVPEVFRPVMASQIIANNVQVSYVAFSTGIAAGIPTVLLLAMNGISIGSVFGLYASKGIFNLILAFVAPHGVLELFAICVAGGGGLLLAGALLIPGARTRRQALVEDGARAIRLIAGVTLLLLVAGTIEGLVSPIPWWPLEAKLAVSGCTTVLLYLYLRSGTVGAPVTAPPAP